MSKDPEPIDDTGYWRQRLRSSGSQRHHAIFRCPLERWIAIEEKHRQILRDRIRDTDSVLDAGCAWGRLLSLMPETWCGDYVGMDLSPDFIELARVEHPQRQFVVGDLRRIETRGGYQFDWAVMISIRPMVRRNLGDEEWSKMEAELRRMARRLLYLEYDPDDEGSVE